MATEAEALKGLWTWSTHLRGNSTGTADARKQKTGRLAAQHDEHKEDKESRSLLPAAVANNWV